MKGRIVLGVLVALAITASSAYARITADDAQAIATAVANEIDSRGGVQCNAPATAVVDPAAPTYVTGPKVFQACKMKRNGECKPTRTFFKAVE